MAGSIVDNTAIYKKTFTHNPTTPPSDNGGQVNENN